MPIVIVLYEWQFPHNKYCATVVFALAMATDWLDGRLARRWDRTSAFGSLLDPIADKILVLLVLIVLIGDGVFPTWRVALIVAREFLVSGLPVAAIERGVVPQARDLGKLKTWAKAVAAGVGGFAAACAWTTPRHGGRCWSRSSLTWLSRLDYARGAPGLLRRRVVASP